jgi:hypothetical protein
MDLRWSADLSGGGYEEYDHIYAVYVCLFDFDHVWYYGMVAGSRTIQ